jgi:hypothetical protein
MRPTSRKRLGKGLKTREDISPQCGLKVILGLTRVQAAVQAAEQYAKANFQGKV